MCAAVDPQVIKQTQEELGKYVKKPPLSEKLLNKPPFRFLHDVINVIVTETGFLAGLYTDEELSSENIKDKDAKIAFLQKCIDATSFATGETLSVRPSKIVAGHEADKTNAWLQALGRAISQNVDSSQAVEQVLSGAKAEKPKKTDKKSDKKSDKEKSDRKSDKAKKESSRGKDDKEKSSRRSKDDKDEAKKSSKSSKERSGKEEKDDKSKRKSKSGEGSPEKAKSSKSRASSRMGNVKESGKENSPPHEKAVDEEIIPNGHVEEEEVNPPPRLKSARPPSARPSLRNAADDSGNTSAGPESLLQVDGSLQPEGEGSPIIPVGENNNIDPAILKAMGDPNNDPMANLGDGQLTSEAPDSGVGSLESPKHGPKEAEPPDRLPSSKPGPQPMKAVEMFGGSEGVAEIPPLVPQVPISQEEPQQTGDVSRRPRTGRRSARPPSARPAPPRVRERREIPKEELQRPPTSKPVANVIVASSDGGNEDEDDNFTVEESKPMFEEDPIPLDPMGASGTAVAAAAAAVGEDGDGAGLLVAQILESKKELEDGRRNAYSPETPGHRRVQIEKSQLSDANRRKEREIIQKDVQKLVGSIQSITRSVNPLAKMLDYLQEDLDSMQKELETWRNENKVLAQTLKREQSLTDQDLEPLRSQLAELETAVQDQRDKLSAVKSNILRNNDKISRMMTGINQNV
ncbi:TRAF3-interacting protein 1-like isoform X2 [Penaeus japonicus]|uniref:TRAF3-interacting protein 1-like isoform X2 n=1 Tax=Penaeus japonicus TaxID=27405 RepID=UPI001C716264|nr:TRAF3-interacting protein 1-like isoform X2 [Penaeus japonicus]